MNLPETACSAELSCSDAMWFSLNNTFKDLYDVSVFLPHMIGKQTMTKFTFLLNVFREGQRRVYLTVMRSSLSAKLAPSFLQEIVGSGCPRGGWHSSTAGSPTATITSTGFCLKSSRITAKDTFDIWCKWIADREIAKKLIKVSLIQGKENVIIPVCRYMMCLEYTNTCNTYVKGFVHIGSKEIHCDKTT